jgi:hypothetical protein
MFFWLLSMLLQYNAINIQIEHFTRFDQRDVYAADGVTYLYTHFVVEVIGVLNPKTVSETVLSSGGGGDQPIPDATDGTPVQTAARAMQVIRPLMMQKQQLLQISIDHSTWDPNTLAPAPLLPTSVDLVKVGIPKSNLVLESPMVFNVTGAGGSRPMRMPCDARFGPNPIDFQVLSWIGEKTAIVKFSIETWLNECPTVNFILSHNWSMTHELDEDYYTTRTIEGEVVFRRDWLEDQFDENGAIVPGRPFVPDYFRKAFFHPIPDNMKRRQRVQATDDGCTINYTLVDEEQPMNLNPAYGITRIEGRYWREVDIGAQDVPLNPSIPTQNVGMTCRAWGTRATTRFQLVQAAIRMATAWNLPPMALFADQSKRPLGISNHFRLEVDIVEKNVSLTSTAEFSGWAGAMLNNVFAAFVWPADQGPDPTKFPATKGWTEDIGDFAAGTYTATTQPGQTFNPPNDGNTRGTYLERMVSAALAAGPCQLVPVPVNQPVPPTYPGGAA